MPRHTLPARTARAMQAARKTRSQAGGRPRTKARRCPCGAMTLKRAKARGRTALGHDPACEFYRERAIIV
jgi:hypothetical protein